MGYEGFDFGRRFTFGDSSNYPVVTECKSKSKIKVTKLAVSCCKSVLEIANKSVYFNFVGPPILFLCYSSSTSSSPSSSPSLFIPRYFPKSYCSPNSRFFSVLIFESCLSTRASFALESIKSSLRSFAS